MELLGIDSRWLYLGLVGLVVLERLLELVLTRRNLRWALAHGGVLIAEDRYPRMVALHSSFLLACPLEVVLFDRPFLPWLGWPMLGLLVSTMALRYWAISSLGKHWTTRVVVVPGAEAVRRGPYRFLRHPNYVAVVLELAALPLVHTAWLTAAVWSAANLWVLRDRIRVEEQALAAHSQYETVFGEVPRFLPGGR